MLIASLDAARSHASSDGRQLLDQALSEIKQVRQAVRDIAGLDVLDEEIARRPGVHGFDPFRIVVRTGRLCARRLARHLTETADVHLELVTDRLIVVHFGLGEPVLELGMRFVRALAAAVEIAGAQDEVRPALALTQPLQAPAARSRAACDVPAGRVLRAARPGALRSGAGPDIGGDRRRLPARHRGSGARRAALR